MATQTDGQHSTSTKQPATIVVSMLLGVLWAWAGGHGSESFGGATVFAVAIGLAFAINLAAFVPSFVAGTEHYYDVVGSLTYLSVTIFALLATDNLDARTLLLGALVIIWSGRLGTFLFRRIKRAGQDDRFDSIKTDPVKFLMAWTLQGLWVTATAGAALAAIGSADRPAFGLWAGLGLVIWVFGFAFEVIADNQKSAFKADPANNGRYIDTGLWSISRHPNYFGEITLWFGVALIALPALDGWQYLTLLSPVFVAALLTRGSGIPLLERKADRTWGAEADYQEYKANTPVLIPRLPR